VQVVGQALARMATVDIRFLTVFIQSRNDIPTDGERK
jgi:hypothetical protein